MWIFENFVWGTFKTAKIMRKIVLQLSCANRSINKEYHRQTTIHLFFNPTVTIVKLNHLYNKPITF